MSELTERQKEIYDYIRERIAGGMPPTVREIGTQFGIRSPNGVLCHVDVLVKKGYITRDRFVSRGIRLVGQECCPTCGRDHEKGGE